jgi:hypothetical protein
VKLAIALRAAAVKPLGGLASKRNLTQEELMYRIPGLISSRTHGLEKQLKPDFGFDG